LLKILFFIEDLGSGGKERRLVELIRGLLNNKSISMELVLTRKNIHYTDIHSYEFKIHYIPRSYLKKAISLFLKFFNIAKSYRPDVIHVWGNLPAIYAIPAKLFLKIPMINSQITDAPEFFKDSVLNHNLTFPFSDRIIANSMAGLKAYKAPKNKSTVIYNGFDQSRLNNLEAKDTIRESFKIDTKYVVGMVATFSELKDYETYIHSANQVLSKNKEVTFLCIGSGDDGRYKKLVKKEYVNKVLFLGKQNQVESIMNLCDIGVLATFTEGISNALLEFSALGKPVITNFGGGNIEIVNQGVTGYLVNQRSPGEMAEKIEILLNNEKMRTNLGEEARKLISYKFSIEQMINGFITEYAKVVPKYNKL